MDLAKFQTLASGGLWLARLDQFGTPFEASLPQSNALGLLAMLPADGVAYLQKHYQLTRDARAYASCWHVNSGLPPARLWREFDPSGEGLAVRTSYSALVAELERTCSIGPPGRGPIHIGMVSYIDHSTAIIRNFNVLEAAFCVRDKWAYQAELRVLVYTNGTAGYDHLYAKEGFFGPLVVAIPPNRSSTGSRELIGGHLDGRAMVFKVDGLALIHELVPQPAIGLRAYWRLLKAARGKHLAHLVRSAGFIRRILRAVAIWQQRRIPSA